MLHAQLDFFFRKFKHQTCIIFECINVMVGANKVLVLVRSRFVGVLLHGNFL